MAAEDTTELHTAPSFSIYATDGGIDEHITSLGSIEFSFGKKNMELIEEEEAEGLDRIKTLRVEEDENEPASPPMYLATGLGIDGPDFGGADFSRGMDLKPITGDESDDLEEYYKRMVNEYPSRPLLLRNYAQLLQSKGNIPEAEKYYFLSTLADPADGESLMHYAKIVWELHRDRQKAASYFERAAQAALHDSDVLAAYASFLWEIGDEEEDGTEENQNQIREEKHFPEVDKSASVQDIEPINISLRDINVAGVSASYASSESNIEEYYEKMVEEDPSNPLFLRNYARFLCQSKGDLQGAKNYYLRAIRANPSDSVIISEYARLMWDHFRDHDKALCYFEQAVHATPEDSNVLAAYARFLWETEANDEQDDNPEPIVTGEKSVAGG